MNAKDFACLQKQAEPQKRFAYHNTHEPPLIGMWAESLGRFAQLAHCWKGEWVKDAQELEIAGVIHPFVEGWVEVTQADVDDLVKRALHQFKGN